MQRPMIGCIAVAIVVGVFGFAIAASYIVGGITGQVELYHQRYHVEEASIRQVLDTSPDFSNLTIHEASNGYAYLTGTVPDQASLDRLTTLVHMEVGKSTAKDRLRLIEIVAPDETARRDSPPEHDAEQPSPQ